MKRMHTFVSLLLILSLLLPIIPGNAEEANDATSDDVYLSDMEKNTEIDSPEPTEATILYEDESLRGKHEKHFLMSDGTYQVNIYNEPIHYETDSGWAEVDNTLRLSTARDGTTRYATTDGLVDVSFAQSSAERLVTMSQEDYYLSWDVTAVTAGKRPVAPARAELATVNRAVFSAEDQMTMALKSTSTLRYRNALSQDADLEYIVLPSRVKENIILNSKQDISAYVITVYVENLTAQLQENREILFINSKKEVVFTMTSPYMYDSAGGLSEKIDVEMTATAPGVYSIRMTPDASWLADASRVYPITIDPQVTTSTDPQIIIDNYVMENSGVQNYTLDRLLIGMRNGNRTRTFVKFSSMPTIPSDCTITAAQMTLWLTTGQSTGNTASAYMVTGGDWSSTSITWANMPAANTLLQQNISHNNLTKYTFSCLPAVQHWYIGMPNGKNENYGIMLRYYNESINDYNPVYSADCVTESQRPSLTITYQAPSNTVNVLEGFTDTLNAADISGTISWSSNNTAVATVDSSGKVTGVKAGRTTITASVGGVVKKAFVVYVKIVDGVYYVYTGTGMYMGTNGKCTEGTSAVLLSKSTSGMAQLRQLWKIAYLDGGYYSIRPMYKLDMGLGSPDGLQGNVELETIGTSDSMSSVPGNNRWTIEYAPGGYVFCCAGTRYLTMQGAQPIYGANVVTNNYSTSATGFLWSLQKVSAINNQLLLMDATSGASVEGKTYNIEPGETVTLEELGIVTSFVCTYNLSQTVSWSLDNTEAFSFNSSTGAITARYPSGSAQITATHWHNGQKYEKSFTIVVSKQMNELIDKMGDLYDVAYSYVDGDQYKAFEQLFNYIRGQTYNGTWWPGIAGNWDTGFVNFVANNYPSLHNYFIYDYSNVPDGYKKYVVADTSSDGYIDFPHMTATFNRLFYTGDNIYNGLNVGDLYDDRINDLSGWAGDCQSLIAHYFKAGYTYEIESDIYNAFYPMIGQPGTSFSYEDILADVDACNLYSLLTDQTITIGAQLETVLRSYYYNSTGNVSDRRFTTWVGSYRMDTLYEKFYDYCNDYSTIPTQKWPLLNEYSINDTQQIAFSRAFADYFWAQKSMEVN